MHRTTKPDRSRCNRGSQHANSSSKVWSDRTRSGIFNRKDPASNGLMKRQEICTACNGPIKDASQVIRHNTAFNRHRNHGNLTCSEYAGEEQQHKDGKFWSFDRGHKIRGTSSSAPRAVLGEQRNPYQWNQPTSCPSQVRLFGTSSDIQWAAKIPPIPTLVRNRMLSEPHAEATGEDRSGKDTVFAALSGSRSWKMEVTRYWVRGSEARRGMRSVREQ
ncbi:hypothetical protein FB451DRAFT_1168034 [Mycena latifolia]|nr:hypothetical protein FB451DRAFT_1168034 [Mycena latifolia]